MGYKDLSIQGFIDEVKDVSAGSHSRKFCFVIGASATSPNLLQRNFNADKPFEKWATDISEFSLLGKKIYFSSMIDLFNGEIVGYSYGFRPSYSLVDEMLQQVLPLVTQETSLVIHSDQGWHYQMKRYRHDLRERNIQQSMSRKGNCLDNAVIESFFGLLKSEFFYLNEFQSIEDFLNQLDEYISYYNEHRIKLKLNGLSPVQYRIQSTFVA